MRRDVCYFFAADVKDLYNAYLAAASNDRFRRECSKEPYHTLSFGLNFSMKYNFNGGACTVRFMPCTGGSAVNMRFTLAQGMGARYEAYARDLSEAVTQILGVPAQKANFDVELFLKPELRVVAEAAAPVKPAAPAATDVVDAGPAAPHSAVFCTHCGKALNVGDRFCSGCGTPVPTAKPVCPGCGKQMSEGDAFCSTCGTKLN